jgi:hypothetical protein
LNLDRRTVVVGVAAAVAVAAAAAATAINHKAGTSHERKEVSAYVDTVNAIQNAMGAPLTRVLLAYRDLAAPGARRQKAPGELAVATATLTKLDRRLSAVVAPPEAVKLRALILRLVAQEAALTKEVQQLAVFTPRFTTIVDRLRSASARFEHDLHAIPNPKAPAVTGTRSSVAAAQRVYEADVLAAAAAQAQVIDTYDEALVMLLRRLHRLDVPAVVAPAFDAEVRSLEDVVAVGGRLSSDLRSKSRRNVADLMRAFTLASREAQTVAVQRAQIAAIRAYNRRARNVGATADKVQAELMRLGRDLP